MPDSKVPPSENLETPSADSLEKWHRVVKDPLFLQVMQAYRFDLVEALARNVQTGVDLDKEIHLTRGALRLVDALTSGGLDKYAQGVLGIDTEGSIGTPTPYMRFDSSQQENK